MTLVHIAGGGRWARLLASLTAGLLPGARLRFHSPRAAGDLAAWGARQPFAARLAVSDLPLDPGREIPGPLLVANQAAHHLASALPALEAGWSVLVEKPLALTEAEVARLLAVRGGGRLALSHVFLFHPAVEALASLVEPAARIAFDWSDPPGEQRHGAVKRHDASLSVAADVLPHIAAILRRVSGETPRLLAAEGDWRRVALMLALGEGRAAVRMEREGTRRRRRIALEDQALVLDFAGEPARLERDGAPLPVPLPSDGLSPLERQLRAFFTAATGGPFDPRLDPADALATARLTAAVEARLAGQSAS